MWYKLVLFVLMSIMIYFSFELPAPQQQIGESSRIFYYHIPQAWICVIAFAMSMFYAIQYLSGICFKVKWFMNIPYLTISKGEPRQLKYDDKAMIAAKLGFIFCVLATVTGAMFAKVTWGMYWNWDPRQTSIFILLLIYGAYFALRGAIEIEEKRAALSAVYSIFAFVTVPFLIFIVPRMVPTLHPNDSIISEDLKFNVEGAISLVFFSSLALFTVLYIWLFNIGVRVQLLVRKKLEQEDL